MSDARQHEAGQHGATLHQAGSTVVIALTGDIDLIAETDARTALEEALALLSDAPRASSPGTRSATTDPLSPDGPDRAGARSGAPARDACGPECGGDPAVLVMDLSAVSFFSSAGLQLLVTADRAAASRGVAFRVATGTHRSVLRTLHLTGLDTTLNTFTTCEDAMAGSSPSVSGQPSPRVRD